MHPVSHKANIITLIFWPSSMVINAKAKDLRMDLLALYLEKKCYLKEFESEIDFNSEKCQIQFWSERTYSVF